MDSRDYNTLEQLRATEFRAGAASRDAEVAELKAWNSELVRQEGLLSDRYRQLRNELETERMRNVACGVVAMADTPDSARLARDMHPDYMSASCSDVARRVDECIKLREQLKLLRDAVKYSKHQCESIRTWGGMSWVYHPLQSGRIFNKCEEALAATEPK